MKTTRRYNLGFGAVCLLSLFGRAILADQLWIQQYDGFGGDNYPYAVVLDSGGNAVVTGSSMNPSGNSDIYTAKYASADGHLLWEVRYDGPAGGDDRGTGVAIDSAGNVIVTGTSANGDPNGGVGGSFPFDFYTAKYSVADGQLIWERRGPLSPCSTGCQTLAELIKRVEVDSEGNVVVSGISRFSLYTVKYAAADGHTLWEQSYVGPANNDKPVGLVVDNTGNAIVTLASYNGFSPDYADIQTIKYAAADGQLLWQRRYDSGTGGENWPVGVAVDRDGNVLLSGVTVNSCCVVVPPAYYTAKYAAADGRVLWEQLNFVGVDGAVSRDFVVPQSIALDSAGNAIVNERNAAANVTPGGTVKNLVKYAGLNGNVIWEQSFAVGNCTGGAPSALTVDNADNVIVTGDSFGHFLTAKFAATDGHLVWQQKADSGVFSGNFPAPFQSSTSGVGVDGAGNIFVTGESRTANGNLDFVTLKYAPSGNASTTINCPANIVTGTDSGHCSAVVTFSATATDACGNAAPVTFSPASGSSFPKGTTTVTCSTADGSHCSFTVTVQNPIPIIAISDPPSGAVYPVGAPVTFTGSFTDNPGDTHSAQWLVDSFSFAGTVNEANGQVTATATFSSPGVYLITLNLTDACGQMASANTVGGLPAMVVIYDPNGSYVTGGGWINSPAGAYTANPSSGQHVAGIFGA